MDASQGGRTDVVELLLSNGADVNILHIYFLYACYCMRTCIIYFTECVHHILTKVKLLRNMCFCIH